MHEAQAAQVVFDLLVAARQGLEQRGRHGVRVDRDVTIGAAGCHDVVVEAADLVLAAQLLAGMAGAMKLSACVGASSCTVDMFSYMAFALKSELI